MNDIQAEHLDRLNRVRSVPCPYCQARPGWPCVRPNGTPTVTHGPRWDAWYKEEADGQRPG